MTRKKNYHNLSTDPCTFYTYTSKITHFSPLSPNTRTIVEISCAKCKFAFRAATHWMELKGPQALRRRPPPCLNRLISKAMAGAPCRNKRTRVIIFLWTRLEKKWISRILSGSTDLATRNKRKYGIILTAV